jgi:hypothetical protein
MTFRVIIRKHSVDDGEHHYHGIVFLNPNKVRTKRLKFSESDGKLRATFSFDGNPIKIGEKFLACLVAVNEGEEIDDAAFKIAENSPAKRA